MEIDKLPTENYLVNKKKPSVVTEVAKPDLAEAIRQAAGYFAGGISVKTYDPKDPEQRSAYAKLVAYKEAARIASGINEAGGSFTPRTPEQIDREVIKHAENTGSELIAITSNVNDLGEFWRKVNEVQEQPR